MKSLTTLLFTLVLMGCSASNVTTKDSSLGTASSMAALEQSALEPGVIEFDKRIAADWQVNLSGLVNLKHPKAVQAGLKDRAEPIHLYTYVIKHPTRGTYLVDSGISESFRDPAENNDISFIVKLAMGTEYLKIRQTTAELNQELGGIDGVFLTHIHLDHIMGLTDLNSDVPVYIGPGDVSAKGVNHLATASTTNNLLKNVEHLKEWQVNESGVIDVFGDGSFWAIHSPGHSPGSTAYLANTTAGPQLLLGDVTHTKWGWENRVEPGTFSANIAESVLSLNTLVGISERNRAIQVHPGHQSL